MGFEDLFVTEQDAWGIEERNRRESKDKREKEEREIFCGWVKGLPLSSLIQHYARIKKRLGSSEFEGVRSATRRGEIDSAVDYRTYEGLVYQASTIKSEIDGKKGQ